jgi:dienelactone hydrolase
MRISGSCCAGLPGVGNPRGKDLVDNNNIKYYITSPQIENYETTKAVIIISDVFGYDSIHTRIIADRYSDATKYTVYVPDVLKSHNMPETLMIPLTGLMEGKLSFFQSISAICSLIYNFTIFASYNSTKSAEKFLLTFIDGLNKTSGITSIATIGYCFGGDISTSIAKKTNLDIVKCCCIAHAGGLAVPKDIMSLKKPSCFILPHEDFAIKIQKINIIKEKLSTRNDLQFEVLDYPKMLHGNYYYYYYYYYYTVITIKMLSLLLLSLSSGFACRGDENNQEIKAAKDDALEKSSQFINKILS